MSQAAPFYNDVALGPDSGHAVWATTSDGVRVRLAIWPTGDKGTVLLFPGRTEYVEKYGLAAGEFAARGYSVIAIDWRGQGLADHDLKDSIRGHVAKFLDYQKDVAALMQVARDQNLPEPYYLLGHSMGGSIGLRALMNGLPVKAAVFTSPMWGISLSTLLRPVAWTLSTLASHTGFGHLHTPGSSRDPYVLSNPFDDNMLTGDRDMFDYMHQQLTRYPALTLGSPSLHWLFEALVEALKKTKIASPDIPALTFLGEHERIVDVPPILNRMAHWPGGRLEIIKDARHEVMMETPAIRAQIFDQMAAHFAAHP